MKLKSVLISLLLFILIAFLSTACGSAQEEVAAPSEEVVPTKSETLKELEAMEPTFVVHFDGKECLVEGPSEIKTGDHLFPATFHRRDNNTVWSQLIDQFLRYLFCRCGEEDAVIGCILYPPSLSVIRTGMYIIRSQLSETLFGFKHQ